MHLDVFFGLVTGLGLRTALKNVSFASRDTPVLEKRTELPHQKRF